MWILSAIANAIGSTFIGKPNYLFDLLFNRVQADGGVTEAEQCTISELTDLQNDNLLSSASLMLTPTSYKEGKLYSVIPSDGSGDFTFTRATTATRVNSDGLVELVPYNLIRYSEQFDNAAWTKTAGGTGTAAVVTANVSTAPNGTLTADRVVFNRGSGTSDDFSVIGQTFASTSSGVLSFWIKSNTGLSQEVDIYGGVGAYDWSDTITVTNEWVRITYQFNVASNYFYIGQRQTIGTTQTADVLLWGAQVVEGTNALPYQKTETRLNIPRLDYSNGTCPSILLEPQRTNLALQSSSFDSATWVKLNASVTANSVVSPSGIQDADSMVENTATGLHIIYQSFTSASSTTYTYSCYIKPDTRTRAYLRTDISVGTRRTLFDLTGAGSVVTLSHTSATIKLLDNGYYYCTVTFTEGTGGSRLMVIEGAVGTSVNYAGNGLTAFYLWGAQLEAGSYATSYIPTTTASVTRNDELLMVSGVSSLIDGTQGTLYLEVAALAQDATNKYFSINDGTISKEIVFQFTPTINQVSIRYLAGPSGGGIQCDAYYTISDVTAMNKFAYTWQQDKFELWYNGNKVISDTSGNVTTGFNQIRFGRANNSLPFYSNTKAVCIWKTPLTDDELEKLTGEGFDTYALMANNYNYILQ